MRRGYCSHNEEERMTDTEREKADQGQTDKEREANS